MKKFLFTNCDENIHLQELLDLTCVAHRDEVFYHLFNFQRGRFSLFIHSESCQSLFPILKQILKIQDLVCR